MRRVEIIAKGDVQRVGYRDAVQNIARKLRLSGTVENVEPYDVRIVAEGEEDALKEFVNAVNIQERPIMVEELEVRWGDATGEFQYFRILRGDWQEELGERFDVAIRYLHRSIELGEQNLAVSKETLAVSKENLSIGRMMLEKQDQMLEKQDRMLEKQDAMLEKQDETIEELRGVRSDLREHMDKRFSRIENEIAEIKRAIRELGGSCI
ncbi:acylphosphatase [Methanothrix thermoacetophila]|uniref:acylphosphatase n=1 Tax=Methanothrix thermoacetophila (strain DSM 6194 / JCM 14653 / NBRC 101360 / PT) TaxID=349307 RepID=A0B7R5_METTP|nr:acylphosphatase [Methanothrix thermoacetophila]ABK14739.1 acylphosphatases-like protein [Methanothrix thermoacetophila PT]